MMMARDLKVPSKFLGFEVSRIIMACSGGSSKILRSAFWASGVSFSASFIILTLYFRTKGFWKIDILISRTWPMEMDFSGIIIVMSGLGVILIPSELSMALVLSCVCFLSPTIM